jgi:hypothetical protein
MARSPCASLSWRAYSLIIVSSMGVLLLLVAAFARRGRRAAALGEKSRQ